jgi:hypothetical protein
LFFKEVLEVHMKIGVALRLTRFSFVMALAGSTFVGTKIVAAHPTMDSASFEDAPDREEANHVQ